MANTRVIQDPFNANKWQAQYYNPAMALWFDLGDGSTDKARADKTAAAYRVVDKPVQSLDLGDNGEIQILIERTAESDGEPNTDEVTVMTRDGVLSVYLNGDELVYPSDEQ